MTEKTAKACFVADLLAWFCIYYGLLATGLCLVSQSVIPALWALLSILPFTGTVLLSRRAGNALIYTIYHLMLMGALWFVYLCTNTGFSFGSTLILTASIIIPFIIFFVKRINAEKNVRYMATSPYFTILFFVLWIIAGNWGYDKLPILLIILACVYLLGNLLGKYFDNLSSYIENNSQVANMPLSSILNSSHGMMALFMVMAAAAILLFTNLGFGRLITQLKDLLLAGIRFLFSLVPSNSTDISETREVIQETQNVNSQSPFAIAENEGSPMMMAISDFMMTVFKIALILGAAALIIYAIYHLYQRFGALTLPKRAGKVNEDHCDDVIEKIIRPKKTHRFSLFSNSMPEDKIRRIYFRKIQGYYKKESIDPSMPPTALTQSIKPSKEDVGRAFTEGYEKARYSCHEASLEEINDYKNLAKKL